MTIDMEDLAATVYSQLLGCGNPAKAYDKFAIALSNLASADDRDTDSVPSPTEASEEVDRYRELLRRLTRGAGPDVGDLLVSNGWVICPWCRAHRTGGESHYGDCPWPEVLEEAGL